jgi:hypothetical protein
MVAQLAGCGSSPPALYWHEDPNGIVHFSPDGQSNGTSIETNDLARLQKKIPFTIVLPKYFPDGKDSYRFQMISYELSDEPKVSIEYYNLKNKKEINIDETPINDMDYLIFDSEPGLMETQAKLNGDTVITIAGIQLIEGEEKNYVMPRSNYMWHQNNLVFSGDIYGYDITVARKIIESIIRSILN